METHDKQLIEAWRYLMDFAVEFEVAVWLEFLPRAAQWKARVCDYHGYDGCEFQSTPDEAARIVVKRARRIRSFAESGSVDEAKPPGA